MYPTSNEERFMLDFEYLSCFFTSYFVTHPRSEFYLYICVYSNSCSVKIFWCCIDFEHNNIAVCYSLPYVPFMLQRTPSLLNPVRAVGLWWPEPFTLFLHRGMSRCPWRCRGWFLWQPREGNPAASHCHETATYTHSSRPLLKKNSKHTAVSLVRTTHVLWNTWTHMDKELTAHTYSAVLREWVDVR